MVNWKVANYATGIFSVLVFIITTIIYIMFLFSQHETVDAVSKTWDNIDARARNKIQQTNERIAGTPSNNEPIASSDDSQQNIVKNDVQPNPYQNIPSPMLPGMSGGKMSKSMLAATILELMALGFSAIIWGLSFGEATTANSD